MILTHSAIRALPDLCLGIVSGRLAAARLPIRSPKAPARPGFLYCLGIGGPRSHRVKRGITSRMNPAHFMAFYVVLPLFVGLLLLQLVLWLTG
jgi:hypothetical protein